ncbi:MAG TPA: antitoxin Xre/MbcA/ParS toxin-binding domain-containing protein [Planctomycetota bacterium]|nr:antitoxin Xre/MbcA/ParS toxin-binding domain-containing protein [Planctomycetota bacterium]
MAVKVHKPKKKAHSIGPHHGPKKKAPAKKKGSPKMGARAARAATSAGQTLRGHALASAAKAAPAASANAWSGAVEDLRAALGVSRRVFARLVGHTERSVANWETKASTPQGLAAQRLAELNQLTTSLGEVIDPKTIGAWLERPNPAFGGSTPAQLIERGEIHRLWKMVFELHSGAFE